MVGIALEAHTSGEGEILMLVGRGWIGATGTNANPAAGTGLERSAAGNASIERRLSKLEAACGLVPESPQLARHAAKDAPGTEGR